MDKMWFYVEGGQRQGPVPLEILIDKLLAAPEPHRVLVWHQELASWQEAGSLPELSGRLPPPRPSIQPVYAAPESVPFEDAETIAGLYRRLVLLVGAQLLLGFFFQFLAAGVSSVAPRIAASLISSATLLVLLGVLAALAVTAYKLAPYLGAGVPLLWAIAMFLPCINILTLLVLSSKAQSWCRRYGIKVGFLGPTKESIEELRRRVMTSPFE
jgi:uncharacterized protein DUF4339